MECMDKISLVLLLIFVMACSIKPSASKTFNVIDFGALGNGITDDSKAFSDAWASACGSAGTGIPRVIVPKGRSFLLNSQTTFSGRCKSSAINFQIEGEIMAPTDPVTWQGRDTSIWIQFKRVNGLRLSGQGKVNGRGQSWWNRSCKVKKLKGCTRQAPSSIKFIECDDLQVSGLTSVDSPQIHFAVLSCIGVRFHNMRIQAPASSPNTDGIHLQDSQHVRIESSTIATGDDCVSIGNNVSDVIIDHISCGPGHGISVGSLGRGRSEAAVEDVHVSNVDFHGTSNGARIKTWPGGSGYARGISFEHCTFDNVNHPIVINQYYNDVNYHVVINQYNSHRGRRPSKTAVSISNVTYTDLRGTSTTSAAVSLKCSRKVPCTEILFDTLNLTMANSNGAVKADCTNAHGETVGFISPPVSCLR